MFGRCSLRGASAVLREVSALHAVQTPSHTTIQNWILKYGVGRVTAAPERRGDWVCVLDHTVDFGAQKCLLILGLSLDAFRKNECSVTHKDVTVLGIHVSEKMNAAKVQAALEEVARDAGRPVQIVTDHGSDIKKGVEDFLATVPIPVVYTYDISHKTAVMLKRLLKDDVHWQAFVNKCVETKRLVLHTDHGHLAPPKPADKARWLNLDSYVAWANAVRAYAADHRLATATTPEAARFREFFGWLDLYAAHLARWSMTVEVLCAAKTEVKRHGLRKATGAAFLNRTDCIPGAATAVPRIVDELRLFFDEQAALLPDQKEWLGSSDIIESVFGKYKSFSQRTAMKGIGKSILTIPAFTSVAGIATVSQAMEDVTCAKAGNWIKCHLGVSLFARRMRALRRTRRSAKPVKKCGTKLNKNAPS